MATDDATAKDLIRVAMLPDSNVDFPQVTEICERLEAQPNECLDVVRVLSATLCNPSALPRAHLKALTITNELLYSEHAVRLLSSIVGLQEALVSLRSTRDTGLGAPMDENIRMLATEIHKVCFEGQPQQEVSMFSRAAQELTKAHKSLSKRMEKADVDAAINSVDRALENTAARMEKGMSKFGSMMQRATSKMMKAMADDSPTQTQELPQQPHQRLAKAVDAQEDEQRERRELQWALQASLAKNPNDPCEAEVRAKLREVEVKATHAEELSNSRAASLKLQLTESEALAGRVSLQLTEAKASLSSMDSELLELELQSAATEKAVSTLVEIVANTDSTLKSGVSDSGSCYSAVMEKLLVRIADLENSAASPSREDLL